MIFFGSGSLKRRESGWMSCDDQDLIPDIRQRFERPGEDLNGFLLELRDVVERSQKARTNGKNSPGAGALAPALLPAKFYRHLLSEIDTIGWDKVERVDDSLTRVDLRIVDRGGRRHVVQVALDGEYPMKPPRCTATLPIALEVSWVDGDNRLECVLRSFEEAVAAHGRLFDALDDLDRNAWVLEPEHPTHAETFRKIVVGRHSSLLVDLDPVHPSAVPECRFFGSESAIGPLRIKLDAKLGSWTNDCTPRENLEKILEMKFPTRDGDGTSKEFTLECGICYAFRLEGFGVPDVSCEYNSCSRPFHRSCLFEWLRSVPDSRQSFDTLFGQCPYCTKTISVRG